MIDNEWVVVVIFGDYVAVYLEIGLFLDKRSIEDIMIGDQDSDMLAAKNAGIKNRWLLSSKVKSEHATKVFLSHKSLRNYLLIR